MVCLLSLQGIWISLLPLDKPFATDKLNIVMEVFIYAAGLVLCLIVVGFIINWFTQNHGKDDPDETED
jgi:uncharacterized membrane protein